MGSSLRKHVVVQQMVNWHFGENLQIHERQHVTLQILRLTHFGVIVDRQFHVFKVLEHSGLVKVHYVRAYSILSYMSASAPLLQSLLLALRLHFKVHGRSGKV